MRTMLRGKLTLLFMAFALVLALPAVALADDISNDLDTTVDATVENTGVTAGGTKSVEYRVIPQNSDGKNGCNLTGSTVLKVSVASSNTAAATVSPSSLTFDSCDAKPSVTVTGVSAGTADITLTETDNTTEGSFNLAPAKFSVTVTNPAPPADTTEPETSILTGPSGWITQNSATFTFTGSDNVTATSNLQYQHRLDGGAWSTASTSTTATVSNLSEDEHTFEVRAIDENNNVDSTPASRTFSVDTIAPVVTFGSGINDGDRFDFGNVPANPGCSATDAGGSGVNANGCQVSGYSNAVGNHTLTGTARDVAGNVGQAQLSYSVLAWRLSGFYNPVDMRILNGTKAGSTVPMKFEIFESVSGNELTNTSAIKTGHVKVNCASGTEVDAIEEYATGGTSLRYDSTGGQFVYNWQAPKAAAGTCYRVTIVPNDGSSNTLVADFRLR